MVPCEARRREAPERRGGWGLGRGAVAPPQYGGSPQKIFKKSTMKSRTFRHFCKLKWSLLQWPKAELDNRVFILDVHFWKCSKIICIKIARCDSNCRLFSYCFIKRTELLLVILHVLQTLWIFSSFAFPLSSPHYNTALKYTGGLRGPAYLYHTVWVWQRMKIIYLHSLSNPNRMIGIGWAPQTTRRPIDLLAEASVTRLLLSTTVVKLEGGTWWYISLMQLYIFITVQILTYLYTEYLYNFFTSKGGWGAGARAPPLDTPLKEFHMKLAKFPNFLYGNWLFGDQTSLGK